MLPARLEIATVPEPELTRIPSPPIDRLLVLVPVRVVPVVSLKTSPSTVSVVPESKRIVFREVFTPGALKVASLELVGTPVDQVPVAQVPAPPPQLSVVPACVAPLKSSAKVTVATKDLPILATAKTEGIEKKRLNEILMCICVL